jgi:cyanophycinase
LLISSAKMLARTGEWAILVAMLMLPAPARAADDAKPPYSYYRLGAAADVTARTKAGTVLMGGSVEVDEAIQWLCELGGGGDFLVVRAEGTDAYNAYIARLCPNGNSVATLVVPDVAAAFHPDVALIVGQAEVLWIASGDQSLYLTEWRRTSVQRALQAGIDRGVPVGGTSAGLAVLTPFIYSAEGGPGIKSEQALADPHHPYVTLQRDFLSIPLLAGMLGDSHFRERDRLGRDIAFLCRLAAHGSVPRLRVIAVDEDTALLVDPQGSARVVGAGSAYLLAAPGAPEVCARGMPVTYRNIHVYRIDATGSFDVSSWQGKGGSSYQVSAQAGVLLSTQPDGRLY